tara:strand:- start:604 stop:1731 length:1128 start_codon:yes stop_codon:yes gene_type:complete
MLQNKIYKNFLIEIFKSFFLILFALSLIAITIRAVSFLDLIVENGYSVSTYFFYSLLNLFGIIPKFIALSFILSLKIFIIKHINDNEFIILYTSGVKKIQLVKLLLFVSILVLIFNLILSTLVTPLALNKSRQLLAKQNYESILPTIKVQQFSDSFKGFTFFVEKKFDNEIKNIFLHDKNNTLKSLSSDSKNTATITVVAENGIISDKKLVLFNGQIISTKKNSDNEIVKFEQLNIDLSKLSTAVVKKPKIQETSTLNLLNCFLKNKYQFQETSFCNENYKKESLSTLNKRIVTPIYLPILALIATLLLIRSERFYLRKISIFLYSFIVLLFTQLAVKYTGYNFIILLSFFILPIIFTLFFYVFLNYKFLNETKI